MIYRECLCLANGLFSKSWRKEGFCHMDLPKNLQNGGWGVFVPFG